MRGIYIDKKETINKKYSEILLTNKKDINHIKNVYRMRLNDKLRVVDGEIEYQTKISQLSGEKISLNILNSKKINLDKVQVDAAISILKNNKLDMVIQKLAEIGIINFFPLMTKRCIVNLDKKKEKWEKIVVETLKQCGGSVPMKINDIVKLENLDYELYDLLIVAYEKEDKVKFNHIIKKSDEINKILYIIGPEGGFEDKEIEYLKNKRAQIVTLGSNILRSDTAAIVLGGIVKNEFS